MRPLIGVTTSELRPGALATLRRDGLPPHSETALGTTYLRAVEAAGGIPVILAPTQLDAVPALVERLDGVCIAGGPDIDPFAYGAGERHPQLGSTNPEVDGFELAVAHAADAAGMPLLGICRGAQALNVARGGTLHQHVDGHRQDELATVPTQDLAVEPRSRLAEITGSDARLAVNTFHHQAVDVLGAGLRIVARSADGMVEAIEDRTRTLVLGVQWHAETLIERTEHAALFRALIEATAHPRRLSAAA
ncbi:MAG TPA: gamma-glutamyl-gamma-aminobutyrate hydrolase family protein [Solirubrobacteraceae bacterium]